MRRLSAIALIALIALGGGTVIAPAAQADALDVTCVPPSSTTTTFSPPLTQTPQAVTVTSDTEFGPCVSATVSGLTAGRRLAVSVRTMSCLDLLTPDTVEYPISWIVDGQQTSSSTVRVNIVTTVSGGLLQQTSTGTVIGGDLFVGDSVLRTSQGAATDVLLCTAGLGTVSSFYSVGTLNLA